VPEEATPMSPVPDSRSGEPTPEAREPELLQDIAQKPLLSRLWIYTRLSGPGWLQSAITLGGGSLASSLFLGALAGFSLMWLQPVAMLLGIVMLGAIGYVALSTGERPFRAINQHVNPVLGWGWALATAMANIVWCLPQFSLGVASARLNLFPRALGPAAMPNETLSKGIAAAAILALCIFIIWFYDRGGRGIKIFEGILKIMVGIIILCFFGVVVKMTTAGVLDWKAVFSGCVPKLSMFTSPAPTFDALLAGTGKFAGFWSDKIVYMQRDVMISAAATAVGINMTFLLPYSMLAKGWRRNARGLAIFDLSTGLLIPFVLATGCVVIASATQFHAKYHPGLLGEPYKMWSIDKDTGEEKTVVVNVAPGQEVNEAELRELPPPSKRLISKFKKLLDERLQEDLGEEQFAKLALDERERLREKFGSDAAAKAHLGAEELGRLKDIAEGVSLLRKSVGDEMLIKAMGASAFEALKKLASELNERRAGLPIGDRRIAATLIKRSAFDLAASLQPLTGHTFSHYIFGIGVIGMAVSSIIILMLISGFVVCEMLGVPPKGNAHRLACLLPAIGVLGPFIWTGKAAFWLAVPTSVFGMVLAPIAYWTFFCMMNSRSLLGDNLPKGGKRLAWNALMLAACAWVSVGALYSIWNKTEYYGLAGLALFLALALAAHVARKRARR